MIAAALLAAAPLPAGYVDPAPVLAAARKAIGADRIRCITVRGTAYGGRLGQQRYVRPEGDWPIDQLGNYVRTMDWGARSMTEAFDRAPGQTPASFKYGAGWTGGTALQKAPRVGFGVRDGVAWHRDGDAPAGRVPAEIAAMWQLDLWLNPVGFLKAAALPGAKPVATWRWEIGEAGRDGPVVRPEKVHVVSIDLAGHKVDATINARGLIQRLHTRVAHPVLGDLNIEHEFTDDAYADLGQGMRFPTTWHSHQGYDDNYNTQTVSSGHNAFGGTLADVKANDCAAVAVPPLPAAVAEQVTTERLADGVFLMGGSTHNSVAIGMTDHVVVVEAPLSEERSLAVIDAVARLFPDKPIRYLINTHQHFDHIGGLRTYHHIGATIVTHARNHPFYNRDVLTYAPWTVKPDLLTRMPTTELTEGYTYELVQQNHVITDGRRVVRIAYAQPLKEAEGMLIVSLPNEKLLIQADLLDTHAGLPGEATDGARVLYGMATSLNLPVERIVPIHGRPVAWGEFVERTGVARPASAQPLGLDTPIVRLVADMRARAVLDARIPGLTTHPDYQMFKESSLTQLAPASGGQITAEQLRLVKEDLAAPR